MTIGIYSLYWEEPDLIYIGKSDNIEGRRWKEHLRKMRGNYHSNYIIQNAYNRYGEPTFSILEECSLSELDNLEAVWAREFNSVQSGANICEPGTTGGIGVNHPSAKYSKIKYLRIFSRLYKGVLSTTEISVLENVLKSTVTHICNGNSHQWLKEEYPNQYSLMQVRAKNRKINNTRGGRKTYLEEHGKPLALVHEDGSVILLSNITQDCKRFGLHASAVLSLISGRRLSHKKYKLKQQ